MTLDHLLERNIVALGGRQAITDLKSLKVEIHIIEPTFEVDGLYWAERGGQMRVDIFMGGVRVFSEGYDGLQGWQWPQQAEHGMPISPAGARALLHGIENNLFGLHELPARGHYLQHVGEEVIDDVPYVILKVEYADGYILWRYVNTMTWLVERSREQKALHPDLDPTETTIETRLSDFRDIGGGLKRAFHETQVDLTTNQLLQTTIIRRIESNPAFEPGVFACP